MKLKHYFIILTGLTCCNVETPQFEIRNSCSNSIKVQVHYDSTIIGKYWSNNISLGPIMKHNFFSHADSKIKMTFDTINFMQTFDVPAGESLFLTDKERQMKNGNLIQDRIKIFKGLDSIILKDRQIIRRIITPIDDLNSLLIIK